MTAGSCSLFNLFDLNHAFRSWHARVIADVGRLLLTLHGGAAELEKILLRRHSSGCAGCECARRRLDDDLAIVGLFTRVWLIQEGTHQRRGARRRAAANPETSGGGERSTGGRRSQHERGGGAVHARTAVSTGALVSQSVRRPRRHCRRVVRHASRRFGAAVVGVGSLIGQFLKSARPAESNRRLTRRPAHAPHTIASSCLHRPLLPPSSCWPVVCAPCEWPPRLPVGFASDRLRVAPGPQRDQQARGARSCLRADRRTVRRKGHTLARGEEKESRKDETERQHTKTILAICCAC